MTASQWQYTKWHPNSEHPEHFLLFSSAPLWNILEQIAVDWTFSVMRHKQVGLDYNLSPLFKLYLLHFMLSYVELFCFGTGDTILVENTTVLEIIQ